MHLPTPARWFVLCVLLLFVQIVRSQQTTETSASDILRSQVQAIAEEVGKEIKLGPDSRIGLQIEGTDNKVITENAFIQELEKKNYRAVLSKENVDAVLEVLVLAQGVTYEELAQERWKRTIRTTLEVRLRSPRTEEVQFLGNHDYAKVDTVAHKEEGWWASESKAFFAGVSPSLFERVLTPLVVITGSVIVVYLFFTVRN